MPAAYVVCVSSGQQPRRVAITGLATFVGGRMAERLSELEPATEVIALDKRLPSRLEGRVRFHRVDLTDPTADAVVAEILEKERCEVVLHAAFLTHASHDVEKSHELELIGSLHVMNACAAADVHKLVVMSSAEVYGAHPDNPNFLCEERRLRAHPASHSLRDRAEMEGLLWIFASRHPQLVVTSLRPCWVAGPTLEGPVTRHFSGGSVTTLMGYDPLMQLLHEEDLLRAVELVLTRDARGPFNLAGAGVLPLSTLLRLAGKRSLPWPHPLLYRLDFLNSLMRTGDSPAAFYDYLRFLWVVDTERARSVLGFEPEYTAKEAWMSFVVSRKLRKYR